MGEKVRNQIHRNQIQPLSLGIIVKRFVTPFPAPLSRLQRCADRLTDGSKTDWFFQSAGDVLVDFNAGLGELTQLI